MSDNTVQPVQATVSELKPRMRGLTVTFKVVSITEPHEVTSRDDGATHRVADAKVGDSTGTVIIPLWDDAVERFKVGSVYKLENGYTKLFMNNIRLNVGRDGIVNPSSDEITEVNMEHDVSSVVYPQSPRRRYRGKRTERDRHYREDSRKEEQGESDKRRKGSERDEDEVDVDDEQEQ
jgi:replication factor A1